MDDELGRAHLDQQRLTAGLLLVLTIVAVGGVMKLMAGIFQPLVIALLLSLVLGPLVERLHRLRIPRILAILLVIAFILGLGTLLVFVLSSTIQRVVRQVPAYAERLIELAQQLVRALELPSDFLSAGDIVPQIGSSLVSISGSFLNVLGSLTMVLIFLLFFLLEKPYLRPKVMEALQGPRTERIWKIVGHTNAQIGRSLTVKLVVSLATGVLVWIAFSIIGVEFALIWAVLSFLFNFIPSIGSIVIGVVSVLFAFVQFYPDPSPIIAAGISMLTIQLVLGNVIDPKMQGDSLKISPVVILISLLFWGWLWGVVGLFLAVPLTVAIKIMTENIPGYEFIGILMGRDVTPDEPPAAPEKGTKKDE
jgi:predicted PurR-regulated permease PerM